MVTKDSDLIEDKWFYIIAEGNYVKPVETSPFDSCTDITIS